MKDHLGDSAVVMGSSKVLMTSEFSCTESDSDSDDGDEVSLNDPATHANVRSMNQLLRRY